MYIHDRNYFNQTKRTCMEMYEDRKFSNNIALCYDYMSDAFSGDEAIMTVGFCKYFYCIIFYMYFLLSPFSAWHR